VLHDQDLVGEQARVHAPARVVRVVDVPEVHADELRARPQEERERLLGEVRPRLPVGVGAPAGVPARPHEHRPARELVLFGPERHRALSAAFAVEHTPGRPATSSSGIALRSRPPG
jgi:hypothetical protein